jgi:hypothetical protein
MTGGRNLDVRVWMSNVLSDYDLGNKSGLQTKFVGHDWPPASHKLGPPNESKRATLKKYVQGHACSRHELPESVAVFDEKCFKRMGDIFFAGGFFVVRGKLADLLSRFDLGDGGLVALPFYKADLETPYGGDFFVLNFGARKDSILPEQCGDARKFVVQKQTGRQIWDINYLNPDGEVVVSNAALDGADLWFEEAVFYKIFLKDALAQALNEIGLGDVFKFKQCRIVGGLR